MKLVWSDPAVYDLEDIREYIAIDSDQNAARFIAQIIEAAERLEAFPEFGRHVPEAQDEPAVREIIFRKYRIIYRLERERVLILAVMHGSRNLARMKPWDVR